MRRRGGVWSAWVVCAAAMLVMLCARVSPVMGDAETNPFGVVEAFWRPEDACELGAGWERIIFDWSQIQPDSADTWNTLNVDERWLQAAAECGREVVAVVKHTPAWATDGTPGIGVPRGLFLPPDDPGNLWAAFMRRAAAYYAPLGVNRWIIWNEPDIPAGTYGYEFEGTIEDYAQLVKVAYLAAKEANPSARIHLAGVTYWHDVNAGRRLYLERLLETLAADPQAGANGAYFDVATLHIYFRSETVYTITTETRRLLERYGLGEKAIWIGETNASPNRDPLWPVERPDYQITLEQQSAFLVQAAALGLAAGAEAISVYKFFDSAIEPGGESFALIRADGSRRPAFTTWQNIAVEMRGAVVENVALGQTAAVSAVRIPRQDGTILLVMWARTGEGAVVRVPAIGEDEPLLVQTSSGEFIEMLPQAGFYSVTLPGAICNRRDGCAVGGSPLLLYLPSASRIEDIVEISGAGETALSWSDEDT